MMTLLNYAMDVLEDNMPAAWAYLKGSSDYQDLKGLALFYAMGASTLVVVVAQGLPGVGFHGLHIHDGNECMGNEKDPFANAGMHFNPENTMHPSHAGDMPPLLSDGGTAFLAFVTGRFTPEEVIGKTIVIHDKADDFVSQPAGNSGNKIACGVIKANMAS